jgi:arsenate reductase
MTLTTIYHNPRCSKSRQTLQLVRDHGVEPLIIDYIKDPPSEAALTNLIKKLGIDAFDLLRRNEQPYKDLKLAQKKDDPKALIKAMAEHPILIQRPILVKGKKAALGRPPENVLEIL